MPEKAHGMIVFANLRCRLFIEHGDSRGQVHVATNGHGVAYYCGSKSSVEWIYDVLRLFNMTRLVVEGKVLYRSNVVF